MDDRFQDILDTLPEKPPRSRLEPYGELIGQLLRRGRTYRDIAGILEERCQLRVSVSTVHDFVRVRSRTMRKPAQRQAATSTSASPHDVTAGTPTMNVSEGGTLPMDEVQRRIAVLKVRQAPPKVTVKRFQYDPNEPLHVPARARRRPPAITC
jgi:hypothetical protein